MSACAHAPEREHARCGSGRRVRIGMDVSLDVTMIITGRIPSSLCPASRIVRLSASSTISASHSSGQKLRGRASCTPRPSPRSWLIQTWYADQRCPPLVGGFSAVHLRRHQGRHRRCRSRRCHHPRRGDRFPPRRRDMLVRGYVSSGLSRRGLAARAQQQAGPRGSYTAPSELAPMDMGMSAA